MKYSYSRIIENLSGLRPDSYLWYNAPATSWYEALPLGNGSLGAIVFGGIDSERYQLNHDTLYSDEPGRRDLDLDVTGELDRVVDLIDRRRYAEADEIVTGKWLGRSWPCYQPMADLFLVTSSVTPTDEYYRYLDMQNGTHTVSYRSELGKINRESFASHPDNVLAIRVASENPLGAQTAVSLSSPHPTSQIRVEDNMLILSGKAPGLALRRALDIVESRKEEWKYPEIWDEMGRRKANANEVLYGGDIGDLGMTFEVRAEIRLTDGMMTPEVSSFRIDGASDVTIILTAATSFSGFDKSPSTEGIDPATQTVRVLGKLSGDSYDDIKQRHVSDYRTLFERVKLDLPIKSETAYLPTNERIERAADDPSYMALYYQFARYLTISGSRPGSQPMNLQGIWNKDIIPPWASAYTININIQMNYWPVPGSNLIECEEPMNDLVRELSVSGSRVARDMYGREGWVAHHNTSLWRSAQPVDNVAQTTFWPMGSGWLCRHLWDHYLFTCDADFLANDALPLLAGASRFYLQWLTEDADGHLLTPVGTSPENAFRYVDNDGETRTASVSKGPTMDIAIIRECLLNTHRALAVTGRDDELMTQIEDALDRLLPYSVAKDGQLDEWSHGEPGYEPTHRHLSHLYGAYPGDQITARDTPELADAVKRTLEVRGEDSGGWSSAWKANLWARLGDGEAAHRNLMRVVQSGLTNPNLFNGRRDWNDAGALFQIDGNFGGAAAVLEMLVQSRYVPGSPAEIDILPALPSAWDQGKISGVRCRGGFEVSFSWQQSKLTEFEIISHAENPAILSAGGVTREISLEVGESHRFDGELK